MAVLTLGSRGVVVLIVANIECEKQRPLVLWCSSHRTLAAEEIPLLLEAGFRVIPLLTDLWTYTYSAELDSQLCGDWKACVDLPDEVVQRLQAIRIFENGGESEFDPEDLQLMNEYVDLVYVSVLPNVAIRLAKELSSAVLFRAFGHGGLNTYTRVTEHYKTPPSDLCNCHNFIWAPILTTLQDREAPAMCTGALHLGAFVSESRLGSQRWSARTSEEYVVETIPRIQKQVYYKDIYYQYCRDHGALPLKILGGNPPRGGELDDARILGFLDDEDYYRMVANARLSIYHGRSYYHLHYHPIEFMALGVPVLFHRESSLAAEALQAGMSEAELVDAGVYTSVGEANEMARAALDDPNQAQLWSDRQRFFISEVFSRKKVLNQARWLRTRVGQIRHGCPLSLGSLDLVQPSTPAAKIESSSSVLDKPRKTLPQRLKREFKRVLRQAHVLSPE
ncbi:MAG: hypothetical protein R3C53_02090 [Pirellulaceae bacterium]